MEPITELLLLLKLSFWRSGSLLSEDTASSKTMSANAYNLARRMSARNEPDLMQEDFSESSSQMTPPSSPYTRKACFQMLDKVCPDSPLPKDCERFQDVTVALQRKNSDPHNQHIAFAGMHPGEAAMARAARDRGMLNHAQIQRRMTSGKKKRIY